MTKTQTHPNRLERGQSLAELSITMTLVLILLAGVADAGRAFFTYITLRDAAQEGALYGSFAFSETVPGSPGTLVSPGTACTRIATRLSENSESPVDIAAEATAIVQIAHASDPSTWIVCDADIPIQPCAGDRIRVSVMVEDFTLSTPFLGTAVGSQTVDIRAAIEDSILAPAGSQTSLCP
jgi:hypothetical protein